MDHGTCRFAARCRGIHCSGARSASRAGRRGAGNHAREETPQAQTRCRGETCRSGGTGGGSRAAVAGGAKPTLLSQYGEWGAYTAAPGGKKVCFAIAKPSSSETVPSDRPRNPSYMFISSRPADKVSNEVSIVIGYPFKPNSEATAEVGTTSFALSTQQDGAWVKNATEEAHMVEAMRAGQNAIVKGMSAKGTRSTDTFSLRGLAQALDRVDQECK